MIEQWQELKETITELRDNDGTGTQQEVCKFLVNYMGVLEKQMQGPCDDAISRQAVLNTLDRMDKALDTDRTVESYKELLTECYKVLPPVTQEPKAGHWIEHPEIETSTPEYLMFYGCSECGDRQCFCKSDIHKKRFCSNCGAKMEVEE